MKFKTIAPAGGAQGLVEIREALFQEFQKPKSESQCIKELKEIIQGPTETAVWEFDQKFKVLMDRFTFQIPDAEHREWFIARLLPHVRIPLTQQKVATQFEALEIAMKLEATTPAIDSNLGMAILQSKLEVLTIQLQDLAKGKEKRQEVWCTQCRVEGHHRDECPMIRAYGVPGPASPVPQNRAEW
jgi:hypothetical protein